MTQRAWSSILDACDDVDRLVAALVAEPAIAADEGALPGPATTAALQGLHDDARARVAALRAELEDEARDYMALMLVLYLDERIMHQLPESLRLSWPLLQIEWIGSSNGGDEFYRITDRLLHDADTPPELFEVIYFCLSSGFVGRYASNLEGIEDYKELLRGRIPTTAEPQPSDGQERRSQAIAPLRSPAWRYATAAAVCIAFNVLLIATSNCSP